MFTSSMNHKITILCATLLVISGCDDVGFPELNITSPLTVTRIDSFPEQIVCEIQTMENVEAAISRLSKYYVEGWSRNVAGVSLAAKYRLTTGSTEILILNRGITIRTPNINIGREYSQGSGEAIIDAVCAKSEHKEPGRSGTDHE